MQPNDLCHLEQHQWLQICILCKTALQQRLKENKLWCRGGNQGSHCASQHARRVCYEGCSARSCHQLPADAGTHRGRAVQVTHTGPAEHSGQPTCPEGLHIYPLPSSFSCRCACRIIHLTPPCKSHDITAWGFGPFALTGLLQAWILHPPTDTCSSTKWAYACSKR